MSSGTYNCRVNADTLSGEALCAIGQEELQFRADNRTFTVNYADVKDLRLLNYHLFIETSGGKVEVSHLGLQTEDFFEKLWEAYNARCLDALFVEDEPIFTREGDYAYTEQGEERHGIAKISLHSDCLCLLPHNNGARRIPLCFTQEPEAEPFKISLRLDTGEQYRISRIGRDTEAVFGKMSAARTKVIRKWKAAHDELSAQLSERLGERADEYRQMETVGCQMVCGLYSLDDTGFWFAGIKEGKAAVELVTKEQTATYLYTFNTSDTGFEHALRHAMESAGMHREVIFTDIADKPLYRMTVERSRALRFLRAHNAGRIIHSGGWSERLREFISDAGNQ
ncbi:MAG: hypothetical protein J5761_01400 [Paludibacteraceae bacterium]|nr:hypothetical protein [Paludibacteraceae bacterium]